MSVSCPCCSCRGQQRRQSPLGLSVEEKAVCVRLDNDWDAENEVFMKYLHDWLKRVVEYLQVSALHCINTRDRSRLTAGSQRTSAGADVPWSASADRRLPAAFRGPRSTSEALPGTGLQRRQEPAQTTVPPRLPRPCPRGLLSPLSAAQEVPFPRVRESPRRRVLGRWAA